MKVLVALTPPPHCSVANATTGVDVPSKEAGTDTDADIGTRRASEANNGTSASVSLLCGQVVDLAALHTHSRLCVGIGVGVPSFVDNAEELNCETSSRNVTAADSAGRDGVMEPVTCHCQPLQPLLLALCAGKGVDAGTSGAVGGSDGNGDSGNGGGHGRNGGNDSLDRAVSMPELGVVVLDLKAYLPPGRHLLSAWVQRSGRWMPEWTFVGGVEAQW